MYNKTIGSNPNCSHIYAYGVCILDTNCQRFWKIPRANQCDFVINTPDCRYHNAWIDYMVVFACKYNDYEYEIYLGLVAAIFEMLLLFLVLATTAENFFAPTLCAVSNVLGLSENLAGVTLLAFGNAAADIMTAVAGVTILGPELVVGQLIGAGLFVTCMVAASILWSKSFYADPRYFIRDTLFYLVAVTWMMYITSNSHFCTYETAPLVLLYFIYVGVVTFDAMYLKRKRKDIAKKVSVLLARERSDTQIEMVTSEEEWELPDPRDSVPLTLPQQRPSLVGPNLMLPPPQPPHRRAVARKTTMLDLAANAQRLNLLSAAGQHEQVEKERQGNAEVVAVKVEGEVPYHKHRTLCGDFLNEIIPIDDEDWNASGSCGRFLIITKAPIIYLLRFIIPVVDQGALNNGWCKLLNCLHIFISPMFLCVSLRLYKADFLVYVSVGSTVLALSFICAVLVFWKSRVNRAPPFHMAFAVLGFLTSMNMIYIVAHQLVTLVKVTGSLLNMNVATLAMTFLAYGNSVGDVVANAAMARNGYARMAWAACFGSPLLSALLGGGLALTVLIEATGENHCLSYDRVYIGFIANCFFFLGLSLCSSLLIIPMMNFQCRKSYALYLFSLYGMFFVFTMLCEFGVTHPFGK